MLFARRAFSPRIQSKSGINQQLKIGKGRLAWSDRNN